MKIGNLGRKNQRYKLNEKKSFVLSSKLKLNLENLEKKELLCSKELCVGGLIVTAILKNLDCVVKVKEGLKKITSISF